MDDEELIVDLLREALSADFDVVPAYGVGGALQAIAEHGPFAAVVCDLVMPEGGGLRVYEALRECEPAPAVVFMSGAAGPESRRFLDQLGMVPVDKPFRVRDLRARLQALLLKPAG